MKIFRQRLSENVKKFNSLYCKIIFYVIYCNIIYHILCFMRFLGVWGVQCKILELSGQYPQRNNWSNLTTFDPIF